MTVREVGGIGRLSGSTGGLVEIRGVGGAQSGF